MKRPFLRGRRKRSARRICSVDILALCNRTEDAIPTAVEIEDRHVQDQHLVVPTPLLLKDFSLFTTLICLRFVVFISASPFSDRAGILRGCPTRRRLPD